LSHHCHWPTGALSGIPWLVRAAVGARRKFVQHLEALTAYCCFENWERVRDFMMRGQEVGPYAAPKN